MSTTTTPQPQETNKTKTNKTTKKTKQKKNSLICMCTVYEQISFKFRIMMSTSKFSILTPFWWCWFLIKATGLWESKNVNISYLTKFLIDFDEVWYPFGTYGLMNLILTVSCEININRRGANWGSYVEIFGFAQIFTYQFSFKLDMMIDSIENFSLRQVLLTLSFTESHSCSRK